MLRFIFRKFLRVMLILWGATLCMFLLMHAIPGNPWDNYSSSPRLLMNLGSDQPLQQELARRFGLDQPIWRQFTGYILGDVDAEGQFFCGALCGNLGPSIARHGRSVSDVIFAAPAGRPFWESLFGYSLRLVLLGAGFAVGVGVALGMLSAARPSARLSRMLSIALAMLVSIPNFVLGLLAMLVLGLWLQWIKVLPDWNNPSHWLVPALVLAVAPMASIARVTRAALLNITQAEFVRTARAKGGSRLRVLYVHVLRNALVPILTFLGPTVMEMFTGLFVVENLYGFPGIGREYWDAVLKLDYPMVLGLTLLYAAGIILLNLAVELMGGLLDPRLRGIDL